MLARYLPQLHARDWILATAASAAFAWAVGMGGPAMFSTGLPPRLVLIVMIPAWIAALLAMGVAQWLVLRHEVRRSRVWIPATAGAWLVGVMIPVAAISLTPTRRRWPSMS